MLGAAAVSIATIAVVGLTLVPQPAVGPVGSPTPTLATTTPTLATTASAPAPSVIGASACNTPTFGSDVLEVLLGCSADGTRLLIQKGNENLFVQHPDGSETQVTEQLTGFNDIVGSSRPAGATISPDGSRVVFAGLTTTGGKSCHNGALFAVDADGGPAEVLFTSHAPQNGIVRYPTFSPDGTKIAVADGYCDSSHSVWVMNADGSGATQIVPTNEGPLGATHVHALAWSAGGDRIGIVVDQGNYSFATDGSDFKEGTGIGFCWLAPRC